MSISETVGSADRVRRFGFAFWLRGLKPGLAQNGASQAQQHNRSTVRFCFHVFDDHLKRVASQMPPLGSRPPIRERNARTRQN